MVDIPAQRDLDGFANGERAHVPPRPPTAELDVPHTAERGRPYTIGWRTRAAEGAILELTDPFGVVERLEVGRQGRMHRMPEAIGRHAVSVRAYGRVRADGRRAVSNPQVRLVAVVAPAPAIALLGPRRVLFGEAIQVDWEVREADAVTLDLGEGPQPVALAGSQGFNPPACGAYTIRLVARGEGGERAEDLHIEVAAPPVVVDLPRDLVVEAGDMVVVAYRITGAARVQFDIDGGPAIEAPAAGRVEAPDAMEDFRLRLTAYGHDGRRTRRVVRVSVRPLLIPSIDEELEFLASAWRIT